MSVAPYPEYKDSGVEWIGTVPKQWSAKRLSFLFRMIGSGTTPPTDEGSYYDGELPWVTTGELREVGISDTTKRLTHDALTAFPTLRMYPPGTLLIAMYGATIGRLGWLSVSACTNQACCALAVPQGVSPRFAFFALLAANEALILLASGGGQPNINQEKIRAFRLPVPSLAEQEAIAAFLDQETGKIDALVAEQERLIALLKEKRQAVISQAVTKGLNPNAPMKDSGIEWLGQVPAHWRVGKAGFYLDVLSGFAFPSEGFSEDEQATRLLRGINVSVGEIRWDDVVYWHRRPDDQLERYLLRQGDLVIGMDRPWIAAGVRVARLGENDTPCLLLQRVARLSVNSKLNDEYLYSLLASDFFTAHFSPDMTGVSVPHISPDQIKGFVIPIPPIAEQHAIISHLKTVVEEIDTLITEATQAITLLRERRAALISAAVTGKIDVRSLTPTKQEAA